MIYSDTELRDLKERCSGRSLDADSVCLTSREADIVSSVIEDVNDLREELDLWIGDDEEF